MLDWAKEHPAVITVTDTAGVIVYMNAAAVAAFKGDLTGQNILDCHPEPSRTMVAEMLAEGKRHTYTTEKNGVRKLVDQSPWYVDGEFAGLVEIQIVLPPDMPHHVRD